MVKIRTKVPTHSNESRYLLLPTQAQLNRLLHQTKLRVGTSRYTQRLYQASQLRELSFITIGISISVPMSSNVHLPTPLCNHSFSGLQSTSY